MVRKSVAAKSARIAVRLSPTLQVQVSETAKTKGYATPSAFVRATLHDALNGRNQLFNAEEKTAGSLERILRDIRRLGWSQQAVFALIDTLAKAILTCMPEPPVESRRQASALAGERYEALMKSAGRAIQGGSRAALRDLMEHGDGDHGA